VITNPSQRRLRQEDCGFEVSLGYTVRPFQKERKKEGGGNEGREGRKRKGGKERKERRKEGRKKERKKRMITDFCKNK
jgi:hypothetical protein